MTIARRLAKRSLRFARREAATATLKVIASSTFGESTTLERTTTYTSYTVPVLGVRNAGDVDGTVVKAERRTVQIPALALPAGVAPQESSQVVIAGVTYRVLRAAPSSPDLNTPIAYELDIAPIAGANPPAA